MLDRLEEKVSSARSELLMDPFGCLSRDSYYSRLVDDGKLQDLDPQGFEIIFSLFKQLT